MSSLSFYLPFVYTYTSRLKNIHKFISWILIYLLPTFCYFLIARGTTPTHVSVYFLAVTLIYTFYEMGYIQNDNETVKKEENPTLRLSPLQCDYYNRNRVWIYTARLILGLVLSGLLWMVAGWQTVWFLACAWALLPVYLVYNAIRSRANLVLHFVLVMIRYGSFLLIFIPNWNWWVFVSMVMSFPVLNFLERASEERFSLSWARTLVGPRDKMDCFRVVYYLVVFCFLMILWYVNSLSMVFLLPVAWLLAYRMAVLMVIRKSNYVK